MGEWCKKQYGISVQQGTIFDGKYNADSFDVITLWDVLEHTPDPKAVLTECNRILKKDGLLVVNYPDISSWVAKIMGKKWVFLLTVHYYYFNRKTIRALFRKCGLSPVKMRPHFQTLELDYILFRASAYIGVLGKLIRTIASFLGIKSIMVPYWVGQTLIVGRK